MSRKNLIVGIFTLLSVFLSGGIAYGAESENNTIAEEKIIDGINKECSIDLLYEKRGEYSFDYENNSKVIEAIDNRLEQLGVEEVTYREVVSKLVGNENVRVALNPSTSIKWTSTRQTTVYRGKTYEIQIIRGVPSAEGIGELYGSDTFECVNNKTTTAATQNVLGIVLNKVSGELPVIGSGISTVQTVYDIFKGVISGMTGTTKLSNVKAQYMVDTVAQYMYVFVKYSGDVDAGNQILAYAGNQVTYQTAVTISGFKMEGKDYVPNIKQRTYGGSIISPYYSSYVDKASYNFYTYKGGNSKILTRYDILSFSIETVNGKGVVGVPKPNSGF